MDANEYQNKAQEFATGGGDTLIYCLLGAIEELGELIDKVNYPSLERIDLPFGDVQNSAAYVLKRLVDLSKDAGKTAKQIRKEWDSFSPDVRFNLETAFLQDGVDKEAGDVAWMLSGICKHIGTTLGDVMSSNIEKLTERKAKGVICGSGETVEERIANAKKGE